MKIFLTGTDTHVGKTVVASWLCLHTGYAYFKPIQTGSCEGTDRETVAQLSNCTAYPEAYLYQKPASPHEAAQSEGSRILPKTISLPSTENLIIEGAGGILVPINRRQLMVDLINSWNVPVIVVARTIIGTINHTLLTLEALSSRRIAVLGVITTGTFHPSNEEAICWYGKTKVLAHLPHLPVINSQTLLQTPLPGALKQLMEARSWT